MSPRVNNDNLYASYEEVPIKYYPNTDEHIREKDAEQDEEIFSRFYS
ncbi:MAG: hypothetical protein ACK55Z_03375 [bacterium]